MSFFLHDKCAARDGTPRDNLRGQKSLGPLKMSLEMAQKVIVPQFLKQRDINSYYLCNHEIVVENLCNIIIRTVVWGEEK